MRKIKTDAPLWVLLAALFAVLAALVLVGQASAQAVVDASRQVKGELDGGNAVLERPSPSDSGLIQFVWPYNVAVQKIECNVRPQTDGGDAGTVRIYIDTRSRTSPNTPGATMMSGPLSCDGTTTSETSAFTVTAVSKGTPVGLVIVSTSGAPGALRFRIYTKSTSTN